MYILSGLLKIWTKKPEFLGSHSNALLTTLLSWFIKHFIKQKLIPFDGFKKCLLILQCSSFQKIETNASPIEYELDTVNHFWWIGYGRSDVWHNYKRRGSFCLSPCLGSFALWESRCHENTQAALWRGVHGKELRPPANSHVRAEADTPRPLTPSGHCTLPAFWLQFHRRSQARATSLSRSQVPGLQKLWGIKYCLSLLRFEVTFYVRISSYINSIPVYNLYYRAQSSKKYLMTL